MKTVLVIVVIENFPTGENYNNYESVPRAPPYSYVYVASFSASYKRHVDTRFRLALTHRSNPRHYLISARSFVNIRVMYVCDISNLCAGVQK